MKIAIPKNRMEIKHFPKDFGFGLDLALVILFTFLCIHDFTCFRCVCKEKHDSEEARFSVDFGFANNDLFI